MDGSTSSARRRSEYLQGIALLVIVVILWTFSNFLTNTILISGFDKPFAVTYANTSSFALYLMPFFLSKRLRRQWKRGTREEEQGSEGWWKKLGFNLPNDTKIWDNEDGYKRVPVNESSGLTAPSLSPRIRAGRISANSDREERPISLLASNASLLSHTARPSSIDGRRPRTNIPVCKNREGSIRLSLPPLTLRETAILACQFTLVWFGANWSINAGLGLTSVASGTTIGSASGFFTLGVGALLGVDHFTLGRLGAVSMSCIGVIMVTMADANAKALGKRDLLPPSMVASAPLNAPLGDMLALLSAFLYSIYVMLLKVKIGSQDRISMPLMFGIVGAFNILALWPIGVILHFTHIEPFALPSDAATLVGVGVNMGITLVSDLVYLMAMLKSSPLASTLGLSLTIPLAVAGDILRGSHSGGTQAALGSILVLASFVAIGLADNAAMRDDPLPPPHPSSSASSLILTSDAGSDFEDEQPRGRR